MKSVNTRQFPFIPTILFSLFAFFFTGVLALNAFVAPSWAIDYNKGSLMESDFSGQDLTDSSFDHANLRGSNFSSANLQGVRFFAANLDSVNFEGANLTSADLESTGRILPMCCCAEIRKKCFAK